MRKCIAHTEAAHSQVKFLSVKSKGMNKTAESLFLTRREKVSGRWMRGSERRASGAQDSFKLPKMAKRTTAAANGT